VFKEAGAFGPRLLEILYPLSARLYPVEGRFSAERPTGCCARGRG
jgi:hypothetical protein